MMQIATVLAAGNTVVFKPSEVTPLVGHAIAEICVAAQVPPGVVNVVTGDGATGAALVAHEGTRRIIFTGSVATGKKVAVECAKRMCPCILELGGIAPAIVRADADPELAARGVVWGRFANNGQFCVAVERVYVNKQIATPFKAAIVRETARLRVGGANGSSYDVGPLINADARERVERHVADAVAQGASVLAGGVDQEQRGDKYFVPTVLADVTPDMAVMHEETFGSVLPIMEVGDDREAVAHANNLPLGLGMSIWTRDVDAGAQMARQFESGMVWINDSHIYYVDPALPWGGVKQSGIGRTHGHGGLQAVSDIKVITTSKHTSRLWWFPYRARTHKLIEIAVALQHLRGWRAKVRAVAQTLFAGK